jgi:hypothetical protein
MVPLNLHPSIWIYDTTSLLQPDTPLAELPFYLVSVRVFFFLFFRAAAPCIMSALFGFSIYFLFSQFLFLFYVCFPFFIVFCRTFFFLFFHIFLLVFLLSTGFFSVSSYYFCFHFFPSASIHSRGRYWTHDHNFLYIGYKNFTTKPNYCCVCEFSA